MSVLMLAVMVRTQTLNRRELRSFPLQAGETMQIKAIHGHLWVTMEADAIDHVLAEGDMIHFSGPGLLVVESLDEALMEFTITNAQ